MLGERGGGGGRREDCRSEVAEDEKTRTTRKHNFFISFSLPAYVVRAPVVVLLEGVRQRFARIAKCTSAGAEGGRGVAR